MHQTHRLQQQRFELKYLINKEIAPSIREFVRPYLELDDFGVGRPNGAYPVHSIYFDSPDLHTYQASSNGAKNRFKLRWRYYDDNPDTPVFLEVKARVDSCILKQRCGVRREATALLASGQLPDPDHLLSREPRHLMALQRFHFLQNQLNARPKAHNSYLREAWVSPFDNSVRVTFDRQVQIEPFFLADAVTEMASPARVFAEFVILELKFTTRFPNWLNDLVRTFNLMQTSSAKYVEGVVTLGEHRFHDGTRTRDWEGRPAREWPTKASGPLPTGPECEYDRV